MLLGVNVKLRLIGAALQTDCADNAETVRDKFQASYLIRQRAALRESDVVYSLIKTHAIVYLGELDHLPYQCVISHATATFT